MERFVSPKKPIRKIETLLFLLEVGNVHCSGLFKIPENRVEISAHIFVKKLEY